MNAKIRRYAIILIAALSVIGLSFVFFASSQLVLQHWHAIMAPCTECMKSFSRNFIGPTHLLPLLIMMGSIFLLLRIGLYTKAHFKLQSFLVRQAQRKGNLYFLEQAPLAAWCQGLISPSIYINKRFWEQLSNKERIALLAHEKHHKGAKHSLELFSVGMLRILFPLNFFTRWAGELLQYCKLNNELEADRAAIAQTDRLTVAQLLKKTLEFEAQKSAHYPVHGIQTELEKRVACLTDQNCEIQNPRTNLGRVLGTSLSVVLILGTGLIWLEPISTCL